MAEVPSTFAQRLRELREAAGLSQYALAKKSGLSKQGVSHLELAIREPTWQTVQLLAAALGVDCSAFVDPSLQPPEVEPVKPRGRPRKARSADAAQTEAPAGSTRSDTKGKPAAKKGKRKK